MNPDRLLALYERIADTPDAVPRLRRFILDLAVRGKLVPRDPEDEPASELLKRIAADQAKADQSDLPKGWIRAKVGALLDFQYGKSLNASDRLHEGPVPVFGSNGIVGFSYEPLSTRPSIIVGRKGSAGALNLCDGPSWTTDVAYYVEPPPFIEIRFLFNVLQALDLDKLGKGVKPGLSRSDAYEQLMCVPPLAEQRRIVAKVDELMVLCDRLEATRAEREAMRDRLTAASLARLNVPDPETFQDDARFVLDALPVLTTRPDQIEQLRQTILNLAMRGKLVPQDPNDEPASELLKRIEAEKARLVKAEQIKKAEPVADLTNSKTELLAPAGWAITNLQSVCASITDGDHLPPPKAESGIPFLVIGNVRSQQIDFAGSRFVPREYYEALDPIRCPRSGDLLYTLVGSYGIPVVVRDDKPFCVQRHIGILRPCSLIDVSFVARIMESRLVFDQATGCATGIAQKTVPLSGLRLFSIPLPPLAEQHRIVAKVDELMALCERLEASLSTGDDTRRRLLGALLAEALAPEESILEKEPERVGANG